MQAARIPQVLYPYFSISYAYCKQQILQLTLNSHHLAKKFWAKKIPPLFLDTSKICAGLWIQSPVAQTPRDTQASCCYLLVFFLSLGCRTLTLQDTLLRQTALTSAALPVQFLLTRPRASPWRALTMWVGTLMNCFSFQIRHHSSLLSPSPLPVPTFIILTPPLPLSVIWEWAREAGRLQHCSALPHPLFPRFDSSKWAKLGCW